MKIAEWTSALNASIVETGSPDRLLYLYVDRSVLATAGGFEDPAEALLDFQEAYAAAAAGQPFRPFYRRALAWREAGWPGQCPFTPALAMTVLAVTEDAIGATHGIYRRQNDLLGLPAEPDAPPGYQDYVPSLWSTWNEWLTGPGRRYGLPTARTHEHWTYQGWARSQGLIRYRDRLLIEDFFAGIRLSREMLQGRLLGEQFVAWLRYRGTAGERLLNLAEDPPAAEILLDVLVDEAKRWLAEGARTRPPGLSAVQALYFYNSWSHELEARIEIDDRLEGVELDLEGETVVASAYDGSLRLPFKGTAAQLVGDGQSWNLAQGLKARLAPSTVIVFYDEPSLGGLLQVRGGVASASYSVLCRDDVLPDVRGALLQGQPDLQPAHPATPGLPGWSWIRGVVPTSNTQLLRELGVGSIAAAAQTEVILAGGLRLQATTYLSGGEPDLLVPAGRAILLDGRSLSRLPQPQSPRKKLGPAKSKSAGGGARASASSHVETVRLTELHPDPGSHSINDGQDVVKFITVTHIREVAVGSDFQVDMSQALSPTSASHRTTIEASDVPGNRSATTWFSGSAPRVGPMQEAQPGGKGWSSGQTHGSLLRSRLWSGRHLIVVCDDGAVYEVFPETEGWLRELDLSPSTVDVVRALRTMPARPAFLLEFAPRLGQVTAVEVPSGTTFPPGEVGHIDASKFTSELIGRDWTWIGHPAEDRRRRVLALAIRRPPAAANKIPSGQRSITSRDDVVEGRSASNPYDDILEWLSEREKLSTSMRSFADTWAWLCRRHGMVAEASLPVRALSRLSALGHVELDWRSRRVHVAVPTAIELSASNGLLLLAGGRPPRILERLEDDGDSNPLVAAGTADWTLHLRTQVSEDGSPAAPTLVYLEIDPARSGRVVRGLEALGIELVPDPAPEILKALPTQDELLRSAVRLAVSPHRLCERRRATRAGATTWSPTSNDRAPGLYRYPLTRGDQFAWRTSTDGELLSVSLSAGIWLDEDDSVVASSAARRLEFDLGARVLRAPKAIGVPWPVRRALTLRTGLLPQPVGSSSDSQFKTHVSYRNIDAALANRVAAVLGRRRVT